MLINLLFSAFSPNETKKPRTLSKLSDTSAWERRRIKGKVAVQKMVVDLMELYLHRLKQRRPPYLKVPAMAEFASQFPYEPTPDQKQVIRMYIWFFLPEIIKLLEDLKLLSFMPNSSFSPPLLLNS